MDNNQPQSNTIPHQLRILLFTVIGLVVVAGLVFAGVKFGKKQLFNPPASWKTYVNSVAGYTIKIPEDYKIMENEVNSVDGVKVKIPNTTTILSPTLEGLNTNIQISIHYENGTKNLTEQQIAKKIGTTINGKPYFLGKRKGYIFAETPLGPYGSTIIYVESNKYIFTITIESHASYDKIMKYLNQILSSFKFTN